MQIEIDEPIPNINGQSIKLIGEIDRETILEFRENLDEFLKTFQGEILIFDIKQLEFINSEGIGYLSDIQHKFIEENKNVYIAGASERVMDIFYLVGLNQIIKCFPSKEECLAELQK